MEATKEDYLLQYELDKLYEKKRSIELILSEAEEKNPTSWRRCCR